MIRHSLLLAALALYSAPAAAAQEEQKEQQEAVKAPRTDSPRPKLAIRAGKIITSAGQPIHDGVILVSEGKIEAVGTRAKIKIPAGYEEIDHGDKFAMPGLVEAHSHVGGSYSDINEMVYQTNPELRVWDQIRPHNERLKAAIAGGVTTICYIPGSGTNLAGWGVIMKTGPGDFEEVVVRAPGVLKVSQAGNPERRSGEVGSGYMGMNWIIRKQLREGLAYVQQWDAWEAGRRKTKPQTDLRLEHFKLVFHREIPVLVHTQAYQVIQSTLRILHDELNLKVIIGHGTFDSYKLSKEIIDRRIPVVAGPRGFRHEPEDGRIVGIAAEYARRGVKLLTVNTDAPVVPQEELFFQAAMAVRYGWSEEQAIHGLTLESAKTLMIEDRVGSLEVGKDADIVIATGSILDPRNYVTQVLIDGKIVYDITKDRRRF
jgi:imidazolonepropionase-like amidohydrolase